MPTFSELLVRRDISWTVNSDGSYWAYSCDWSGNDLSSVLTTASNCGSSCIATSGCTNFAWTDYNGGTCWLKTGSMSKSAAITSTTSGIICGGIFAPNWTTNSDGSYWAYNCDWTGNDIKNVITTASNCGPACVAASGCTNFAWTDYNGGTCWMKDGNMPQSAAIYSSASDALCGGTGATSTTTTKTTTSSSKASTTTTTSSSKATTTTTTSSSKATTTTTTSSSKATTTTTTSSSKATTTSSTVPSSATSKASTSTASSTSSQASTSTTSTTSKVTTTSISSSSTSKASTSTAVSSTSPSTTSTSVTSKSTSSTTSTSSTSITSASSATVTLVSPSILVSDRSSLLTNITISSWDSSMISGASPCDLTLLSSQIAALLVDSKPRVYMAHGRAGAGKFIAATHNGWFSFSISSLPSLAQFWRNSLYWGRTTAPRVGCFPACSSIATNIQANSTFYSINGTVTQFSKSVVKANSSAFNAVDVLYVTPLDIGYDSDTSYHIETLRSWLEGGGTMIVAAIGWVWVDYDSGTSLNDPANLLLQQYGVYFGTTSYGTPTTSVAADIYTANAYYDVKNLTDNTTAIDFTNTSSTSYTKFAAIASSVKSSKYITLNASSEYRLALLNLSSVCTSAVNWTVLPIASTDYKRRSCSGLLYGLRNYLPIVSHPLVQAAVAWPGVPTSSVPLVTKSWTLNPTHTKWLSTQLYVTAGTSVKVTFCPTIALNGTVNTTAVSGIQIGSTLDELTTTDAWARFPLIHETSSDWVIDGSCQSINITSYFGGLLFLNIAKAGSLGSVNVTGNLADAPYFDGTQTVEAWNASLQTTQAFYSEMEFNGIIFTYPTFLMKQAPCSTSPAAVKAFFDELIPQYFNLSGETSRPYKERLNLDRDISAGGYHAGYAIAWWIYSDFPSRICMMRKSIYETDVLNAAGEFWAYVHELGHNFQKAAWTTMESNTEVTTNIFSVYMSELFPSTLDQFSNANSFGYNSSGIRAEATWRASTSDYASADPFLKLHFYINLRHSFGYEAFRRVFRTYLNMTSPPSANQDEINVWATTFSETVGYDISSFMTDHWKIAISSNTSVALAYLPAYNMSTVISCNATAFPFGLSPCASVSGSTNLLTIKLSTWATMRVETRIAVGISGTIPSFRSSSSSETVSTNVTLGGANASLFGSKAVYKEPVTGQAVIYLQPTQLIPFDTGLTVTVDFSAATTKLVLGSSIQTTFWMENSTDSSLFMLDKRTGADVVF
ncbi:hypothetical protein HK405_004604 [Cladochytrium tenue]|nr:hypothetical protein HK405_004604 [Cladochytrium tenue]